LPLEEKVKILSLLYEAARSQRGGEVIIRSGEESGRVFFVSGKVAWVTVSTIKRTFTQYLKDQTGLKDEEVQEVFEECRRTGANFGETIIEWGLADEATLRRLLLEHLTECLIEILSWEKAESMFVPEQRSYKGSLIFSLEELIDEALRAKGSDRLTFSGHSREEIWQVLRREREPTLTELPTVSPRAGEAPAEAATDDEAFARKPTGYRKTILAALFCLLVAGTIFFLMTNLSGSLRTSAPQSKSNDVPAGNEPPPPPVTELPALAEASPDAGTEPADDAGPTISPADEPPAEEAQPARVTLQIISHPAGARVYLDGIDSGLKTPCSIEGLTPGSNHWLLLEGKKRAPLAKQIVLGGEAEQKIELKLPRTANGFRGKKTVLITTEPSGAQLRLTGVLLKEKTPTKIKLSLQKSYPLVVTREGHRKWQGRVRPAPQQNEIVIRLEKLPTGGEP